MAFYKIHSRVLGHWIASTSLLLCKKLFGLNTTIFSVSSSPLLFFISLFGLCAPFPVLSLWNLHCSFVLSSCLTSAPWSLLYFICLHHIFLSLFLYFSLFLSFLLSFSLSSLCILWTFAMHDTLYDFLLIFLIFVAYLHIHAVIFLPGCI